MKTAKEVLLAASSPNVRAYRRLIDSGLYPGTFLETSYPGLMGDVYAIEYGDDAGNGFIVGIGHFSGKTLVEFDEEYNRLWASDRYYYAISVERNHFTGNLLVAGQRDADKVWEVAELDRKGNVLRSITSTALGAIGPYAKARWDLRSEDHFFICMPQYHTVVLTSWDGVIDREFGEYGVSGTDDAHLWAPYGGIAVQVGDNPTEAILYISDHRNHRVLIIDGANNVMFKIPYPFPGAIEVLGIQEVAVGSEDGPEPIVLYSHWDTGAPTGCIPIVSAHHCIRKHPTIPGRFWCTAADAYEIDFNDFIGRYTAPPLNRGLWKAQSMTAGVDHYSAPVLDYFWGKKTIFLKGTQAGTAYIEIAKFLQDHLLGWWDGTWETYDSFSLVANTLKAYSDFSDVPLGVYRLRVNLRANGTTDGWVVQK